MSQQPSVNFDKTYWPDEESQYVVKISIDDLWDRCPEGLSILIADALIATPPRAHLDGETLTVWLWELGGDMLTIDQNLPALIADSVDVYDRIQGESQKEDVEERIQALDEILKSAERGKAFLLKQIDDYSGPLPEGPAGE